MNIRLAIYDDIDQLIRMRWGFTNEYIEKKIPDSEYVAFHRECKSFLEEVFNSNQWFIWVAEQKGQVLSHVYLELINKVPRPGRITHPFVYMTNVYTLPEHRGKGLGSQLLKEIEDWSRKQEYEFIIVWPSEWSTDYYKHNGYKLCNDPMELTLE